MDATSAARNVYERELVRTAVRERHEGYAKASLGHVVAAFEKSFGEGASELIGELVASAGTEAGRLFKPVPAAWPKLPSHPRGRHAAKSSNVEVRLAFNVSTPAVKKWIAAYSAQLVTGVTDEVRTALNETMLNAFDRHLTADDTAELIENVIGLDSRRADALDNFLDDIRENPGGTAWAGDRKVRVPEEVTTDFLEAQANRYSAELLSDRAIMIARTETIAAANGGQQLLWQQAVEEGLLDTSRYERVWIITPDDRLCEECNGMEDERAPIVGGAFEGEDGPIEGPPLHPMCRCAQGIAAIEEQEDTNAGDDDQTDEEDDVTAASLVDAESQYGTPGTPEYYKNYYEAKKSHYAKGGKYYRPYQKKGGGTKAAPPAPPPAPPHVPIVPLPPLPQQPTPGPGPIQNLPALTPIVDPLHQTPFPADPNFVSKGTVKMRGFKRASFEAQAMAQAHAESGQRAIDRLAELGISTGRVKIAVAARDEFARNYHGKGNTKTEEEIDKLITGTYGYAYLGKGRVFLNAALKGRGPDEFSSGFKSTDDRDATALHEIGHSMHKIPYSMRNSFANDDDARIARSISRYGATNPLEFVAETFAAAVVQRERAAGRSSSYTRTISKEARDMYKKYRGPHYKTLFSDIDKAEKAERRRRKD